MTTDAPPPQKSDVAEKLGNLERHRKAFERALKEYQQAGGRYIDRAPILPDELLVECRCLPDRYQLLHYLQKYGIVAEVGTDQGAFAARIVEVCEPKALHIFELNPLRIRAENLAKHLQSGRCILHEGDSAQKLQELPEGFFDWIYVDGDHTYEGVKRDIAAAAPRVKPGGMLVFNDYAVWSVSSMHRCGVARAVNEFALREKWKMRYLAFQTAMYLDVALVKPLASPSA
jgi:predicted O-methyltransferase YrrM